MHVLWLSGRPASIGAVEAGVYSKPAFIITRTSEPPAFIRDRHLRHKATAHSMIYLPSLALIRFGRRRSMFPTFVLKVARITKLL